MRSPAVWGIPGTPGTSVGRAGPDPYGGAAPGFRGVAGYPRELFRQAGPLSAPPHREMRPRGTPWIYLEPWGPLPGPAPTSNASPPLCAFAGERGGRALLRP